MNVSLNPQLNDDLINLEQHLLDWSKSLKPNLEKSFKIVGQRWRSEAVKRLPVDTGRLKQSMISNVYSDAGGLVTLEVGTNVAEYPIYVEFGTRFIAGGRVLALGPDVGITDAQAMTVWPAKNKDFVDEETGKGNTRLFNAVQARLARGGSQEQMPWLRPAFNAIRQWAIDTIVLGCQPPKKPGGSFL